MEDCNLLPAWSSRPCHLGYKSSRNKNTAVWWVVSACFLITLYLGLGAAHSLQFHSVTARDVTLVPTSLQLKGASFPPQGASSSHQSRESHASFSAAHIKVQQPYLSSATNTAIPASAIPAAVGGALFSLGALIVVWFGQKNQASIAMATVTSQVDKGGDPTDQGSDAQTERHRIEQRVVFNAERWRTHRSGNRFSRALLSVPQSYVIRHLVQPVLAISAFTAAYCAAQVYLGLENFNLPTSLFSLSAPSLGLLLVFRTNASYERWDGARKMIGLVKNRTEDLTRQISVRFPADRVDLKEQMMRYIHAFPFSLKVHLRSGPGGFEDDSNLIEDLTPILKPNELELLLKSTNRPAHVMQCMTQVVHSAGLDGAALFCLDQNLTTLADVLGGCERILRTPIPLSYTRMTTRFLFAWLLLLPLALSQEILKLDHSIWLTIPSVAFIAFGLLGIEEVGVQIEEPFSILPLEAYSEGIRKNTASIFAQMNSVTDLINGGK